MFTFLKYLVEYSGYIFFSMLEVVRVSHNNGPAMTTSTKRTYGFSLYRKQMELIKNGDVFGDIKLEVYNVFLCEYKLEHKDSVCFTFAASNRCRRKYRKLEKKKMKFKRDDDEKFAADIDDFITNQKLKSLD